MDLLGILKKISLNFFTLENLSKIYDLLTLLFTNMVREFPPLLYRDTTLQDDITHVS